MDPVAHTLFGATLAETGLREKSRYATATLIIGANLPDIDAITTLWGGDASLFWRRGWTHGVLAMIVLPLLLVGGVWAWHRFKARDGPRSAPDFQLRWIALFAFVSVWSHPALDWMNTYGVRLLMPFDGTWFYGDALYIVDPWFWLMTAAGVVAARSSARRAIIGWVVLALLASALVFFVPFVPVAVKVVWAVGVVTIVALRRAKPVGSRVVARTGLAGLILYMGIVYGAARTAEKTAAGNLAPIEVQSNPVPGVPFGHRIVVVFSDHYRVIPHDGEPFEVPRREPTEVVRAAMDSLDGFSNWTRYPYWDVEETDDGYVVEFRDLRYVDPAEPAEGFGSARVVLDENLEVDR